MKTTQFRSRQALLCALTALVGPASYAIADLHLSDDLVSLELVGGTRFLVPPAGLVEEQDGYSVTGELILECPLGALPIGQADLFFAFAEGTQPQDRMFDRIVGRAQVPPPLPSNYVNIPSPVMAQVGYDYGEFIDLGVPLQPDRHYLYFNFNAGLTIEFGATGDDEDTRPLTMEIPAGASATLILDLTDPFYFIDGALSLPERKDDDRADAEDADLEQTHTGDCPNVQDSSGPSLPGLGFGIGRSLMGNIPYRPTTTFGIEDKVEGFDGHRIELGSFPLLELPLEISGYVVTRLDLFDVEHGVDPLGFGFGPSFAMGANGELAVSLDFLKVARVGDLFNFGFQLGEASAGVEVFGHEQRAYFSGKLDPDQSWIPSFMPIVPRAELRASGYVGNDLLETEVRLEGEFGLDMSGFTSLTHIDVGEPLTVTGAMRLNDDGFYMEGTTTTNMPFVDFSSSARVESFVSADPEENSLLLEGTIAVGQSSVAGSLELVQEGVYLGGEMSVEDLTLGVDGAFIEDAGGTSVMTGELSFPPRIQQYFQQDLVTLSDEVRSDMDHAVDELEAAVADYEFELSLRGVRSIMPTICDHIIRELNKVPGKVHSRWPKIWGVALPGRSAAVNAARNQIAPYVTRLGRLRDLCRQGDAETTRTALKTACNELLRHRYIRVRVSRLGTVYSGDLLAGGRDELVRSALAAIDRLPETSNRKIAAQRVVDEIQPRTIVHDVADAIEQGITQNIPTIDAIRFTNYREGSRKGEWVFEVDVTRGSRVDTFSIEIGGDKPFIPSLADGFVTHLAG